MPISVKVDMHNVINAYSELALLSGQVPGAVKAAVDDALEQGEIIAENEVFGQINAPKNDIKTRVRRTESDRTTRIVIEGEIYTTSKPIPLRRMSPKQTSSGVVYSPYRSGSIKRVKGAFGPNIPRLGKGVYRRAGKSRTPIERVQGFVLKDDRVVRSAMSKAGDKTQRVLQTRVAYHIAKALDGSTTGRVIYGQVFSNSSRPTKSSVRNFFSKNVGDV